MSDCEGPSPFPIFSWGTVWVWLTSSPSRRGSAKWYQKRKNIRLLFIHKYQQIFSKQRGLLMRWKMHCMRRWSPCTITVIFNWITSLSKLWLMEKSCKINIWYCSAYYSKIMNASLQYYEHREILQIKVIAMILAFFIWWTTQAKPTIKSKNRNKNFQAYRNSPSNTGSWRQKERRTNAWKEVELGVLYSRKRLGQ